MFIVIGVKTTAADPRPRIHSWATCRKEGARNLYRARRDGRGSVFTLVKVKGDVGKYLGGGGAYKVTDKNWKQVPQSPGHEVNEAGVVRRVSDHRGLKVSDGICYISPEGVTIRLDVRELVRDLFGVEINSVDKSSARHWLSKRWK